MKSFRANYGYGAHLDTMLKLLLPARWKLRRKGARGGVKYQSIPKQKHLNRGNYLILERMLEALLRI